MTHYLYEGSTIPIQQPPTEDPQGAQGLINDVNFAHSKGRNSPFIPYTPVITGTSGGFTYGTNAFQVGRYKKLGPLVSFYFQIAFGNPGFVAGGATSWEISLPIPYVIPPLPVPFTQIPLGWVWIRHGNAVLQDMSVAVSGATANTFGILLATLNSGVRLQGNNWAAAQNAMFEGNLQYECAP